MKKNKKTRKGNGWETPQTTIKMPKKYIIDNALEPQPYWNEWNTWRDGLKGYLDGKKITRHYCILTPTHLINQWNQKNKKLKQRRKCQKQKIQAQQAQSSAHTATET